MAQRVRTDATIDAGDRRGTGHRVPDASGRERLVGTPAVFLAWEQVSLRWRTMRRLSMSATFSWNVASAGPFRHAGVAECHHRSYLPVTHPTFYVLRLTRLPSAAASAASFWSPSVKQSAEDMLEIALSSRATNCSG